MNSINQIIRESKLSYTGHGVCFYLFLFIIFLNVITGCGHNKVDEDKPNDELSELMCIYSYLEESYFSGCT